MADTRYYARKLAEAEREMDKVLSRIKRATTSLTLWQRRAKYYGQQVQITDEERKAKRDAQRQRAAAKRRTRKLQVD